MYFQAIRGHERNSWFEILNGAPPYPIDVRFVSVECGDPFIIGVGGSELYDSTWYPENVSTACEGIKRKEEFRTAWKIADELEKLPISSDLRWEKRRLIEEARSITERDLQH